MEMIYQNNIRLFLNKKSLVYKRSYKVTLKNFRPTWLHFDQGHVTFIECSAGIRENVCSAPNIKTSGKLWERFVLVVVLLELCTDDYEWQLEFCTNCQYEHFIYE